MDNLPPVAFRFSFLFLLFFHPLFWAQSNQPPEISVSGRNPFCTGAPILIAENFTITDPDNDAVASFSVQISSGYVNNGTESLYITGSHPLIESEFDFVEGKLTLTSSIASERDEILYADLIPAVRAIVYESLAASVSGERIFSFTIGDANYLPETGHYYEFVEADFITWENARVAAEQREYFGLQGYLATLLSREEAQFCGEQASGTGWIGGSDAEQEGVWKWMTGPEAGTVFWNGGISGSSPNFAFWNNGEPNNQGNEDYVHITDPAIGIPGSWNDLPLAGGTGLYAPRGYIVEYGGMPGDPELNISGTTSIYVPEIKNTKSGEICAGETVVLEASVTEGTIYWYDAFSGGNLLDTGTSFTTPILNETTTYYVSTDPENCASNQRIPIVVTVNPLPEVSENIVLIRCDDDQDGITRFNLNDANSLLSTDFQNQSFTYYTTQLGAENEMASDLIANPTDYQNETSSFDAVWARVENTTSCFQVVQVNLSAISTIIPSTYTKTYEACDDILEGTSTNIDGTAVFNFSDTAQEIIDFFPIEQVPDLQITYYPSESDAINEENAITDISSYRNTIPNTQEIFVRVSHSDDNTCDYIGAHISLVVNPVPQLQVEDWDICDDNLDGDDTNGIIQTIDLESRTPLFLGVQDASLYTVTFHESSEDAISGTSPLSSPYTNSTPYAQIIFVRALNNTTGCLVTNDSFTIHIRPLPDIAATVELKQCDTDTDGFVPFNLNEAAFDISSNYSNETFVFYETLIDAQNGENPIQNATAYVNQIPTSDKVWARAISEYGCYRISEVNLTVSTTGVPASFQRNFRVCDDLLEGDDTDGVSAFDFSSVSEEIRALFPDNQDLTISFYRNETDALAEQNAIEDPSNYRNIGYPVSQDIYVRVDSNLDNDCLGLGHHITLTVEPVPFANPTSDIEVCDDDLSGSTTDGVNIGFNLRDKVSEILGDNQSEKDFRVTFHTTQLGASDGQGDWILNDTNYTNVPNPNFTPGTISEQTIFVRVESLLGGTCYNANTSFTIRVYPLPEVSNPISDLSVCETPTLSDPDGRNRIAQNINLSLKESEILSGRTGYRINYYENLEDAENGENPIEQPTGYENNPSETRFPSNLNADAPAIQTIYYTLTDENGLQCTSVVSNFELVIHPKPRMNPIPALSLCDDALDGDDTNGLIQGIDFTTRIPEIIGTDRDTNNYTVTFHHSQEAADSGSEPISFPYENSNSTEIIFVRIEQNETGCFNSEGSFQLVVNELPGIFVETPKIMCLNDLPLRIVVENTSLEYEYAWESSAGGFLGSTPYLDVTEAGFYQVTATNRNTKCTRTERVEVTTSNIARLIPDFVTVVDDYFTLSTTDVLSVSVDTINNDLGPGDYQFALRNTETNERIPFSGFQDEPRFELDKGGIYEIIVNDRNGCVPDTTLEVSVLQFPKFFTPNNDGINDFWRVRGVNETFFQSSVIRIFNRFGKLVYQYETGDQGWDGTFNGTPLPADDYWYHITLIPSDTSKPTVQKKGNFSLLR